MDLSSHSAAFVASVRRFRRSFSAVLASLAVASQLAKLEFGVHLNTCSHDENEGNAMRCRSPPLRWGGVAAHKWKDTFGTEYNPLGGICNPAI